MKIKLQNLKQQIQKNKIRRGALCAPYFQKEIRNTERGITLVALIITVRMRYVGEGFVTVFDIFNSIGNSNGNAYVFRPVITLSLNVTLSGNSTNGWTIQ